MEYLPLPEFLVEKNYQIPNIQPYDNNGLKIEIGNRYDRSIENNVDYWKLEINNTEFMRYKQTHKEAYEYFAAYDISYGNVVTSGLGFGMLCNWLIGKESVTSIKCIENNLELIEYYNSHNVKNDKLEIIHADINEYTGSCDVLILDHYFLSLNTLFNHIDTLLEPSKNIDHNITFIPGFFRAADTYENYVSTRQNHSKLPDLTEEQFTLYRSLYRGHRY